MGIQRGPFGTGFVRKLGNTVGYKIGGGRYGIAAYQPTVINPKSVKQNTQRAKFTFLQQFGALLQRGSLEGLENMGYKKVRNAFNSVNIGQLTVENPGTNPKVNVDVAAPLLQLSRGYEPMPAVGVGSVNGSTLKITAGSFYSEGVNRPDAARIVIVCANAMGTVGYAAQVVDLTYTSFADGYASTNTVEVLCETGGIDPSHNDLTYYIWAYNIRYVARYGQFAAGERSGIMTQNVPHITQQAGVEAISGRKLYSATAFELFNWVHS